MKPGPGGRAGVHITPEVLTLNYADVESELTAFIRDFVATAHVGGAVVGLSGGIDSSVVGALCVKALGARRVVGLLLPASHTPRTGVKDATELAKVWRIRSYKVSIDPIFGALSASLPVKSEHRMAQANSKARIRMTINYYFANMLNMAVAGTGDRSEDMIGYFTKYGDGGVDFLPIAHLYKTQVRNLGDHLGLPKRIVTKPASPQLWPGHKATDEIPIDYGKLDLVLYGLFDAKMSRDEVSKRTGVARRIVDEVLRKHSESTHKRTYPPMVRAW